MLHILGVVGRMARDVPVNTRHDAVLRKRCGCIVAPDPLPGLVSLAWGAEGVVNGGD